MTQSTYNRYLALPPSGTGPGVLVLHAWWGLTGVFRDFCDRLAEAGFVALAPDLYSGRTAKTVEEAEALKNQWNEEKEAPPVVLAAVDDLRSNPAVKGRGLGTVGFSMGGFWALWLAEKKPDLIKAVTIFYSTEGGYVNFEKSQAAFLGNFAESDPYEPLEGVADMEKRLQAAGRPVDFYTFPGTSHWFFEHDRPSAYNPKAARMAWDRTVEFLHKELD